LLQVQFLSYCLETEVSKQLYYLWANGLISISDTQTLRLYVVAEDPNVGFDVVQKGIKMTSGAITFRLYIWNIHVIDSSNRFIKHSGSDDVPLEFKAGKNEMYPDGWKGDATVKFTNGRATMKYTDIIWENTP
jgi:hypothetical protein